MADTTSKPIVLGSKRFAGVGANASSRRLASVHPLSAPNVCGSISVVIPAYNEVDRLPLTLDKLLAFFEHSPMSYEIIVVDDGSTDETAAMVEAYHREYPAIRCMGDKVNRGKGYAVQQGMRVATGDYLLIYDADGATPIEELERFLPYLATQPDAIIIGSRALTASDVTHHVQPYRKLIGRCFNALLFTLTPGIEDTQCGFKLFPRPIAHALFQQQTLNGFAFDVEILHAAQKNHLAIIEVPVNWANVDGSKVNVMVDSGIMLLGLFRIASNSVRGKYTLNATGLKLIPVH